MAYPRTVISGSLIGPEGKQGLPGVDAVPAAEAVDTYLGDGVVDDGLAAGVDRILNNPSSAPATTLDGKITAANETQVPPLVEALVPGEVADAVDGHVPGSSLGYVERASSYVVTNVAPALAASTAMGLTVTGAGRPVELEFYVPEIYHSVVGTRVVIGIAYQRDSIYQGNLRYVSKRSYSDTEGDQMIVKSQLMLTSGHEYFFYPVFGAFAAGTTSLKVSGAAGGPVMTMSAVSR